MDNFEDLEELKKQISELQSKVAKIENESKEEKKGKRWRAEVNDTYIYINDAGYADVSHENNDSFDKYRFKTRNYFKTEEEAEEYKEVMNTYYDLMDLADELNNGKKIDWYDDTQQKFYIYFDFKRNKFVQSYTYVTKDIGQIYCLNENIIGIAIEKIGTDKLIKLFTYERN